MGCQLEIRLSITMNVVFAAAGECPLLAHCGLCRWKSLHADIIIERRRIGAVALIAAKGQRSRNGS